MLSCVWLFNNPLDCSLLASSVHGIFQARIFEWFAISYSRGSSWPRAWTYVSFFSCTDGQILYHCTTWEALDVYVCIYMYTLTNHLLKEIFSNPFLSQWMCKKYKRMRRLGSITDSMDMNVSKLWEIVEYRRAWRAAVLGGGGSQIAGHSLATKQQHV